MTRAPGTSIKSSSLEMMMVSKLASVLAELLIMPINTYIKPITESCTLSKYHVLTFVLEHSGFVFYVILS